MTPDQYLEDLQKRFEAHFTIEKDIILLGEKVDFYARFCNVTGRTFITKQDVIDRCESYEHCYFKKLDNVTEAEITGFTQFLKNIVDRCIDPGKDHMSTYITGVIISNSINDNARKAIKMHNYSKAYAFYLRGWCDVRLIVIGIDDNEVVTNKAGKRVQKVYQIIP